MKGIDALAPPPEPADHGAPGLAPGVERRRPFGAIAQAAAVVAVVAVWVVGVVLIGAGGRSEDFDGSWSAPVLRLLAAVTGLAGGVLAARAARLARAGGRPSAARFCASAVPVSVANGLVALLPDRPEVAVASFAMTGVLLSWGLWWWHEVRRTRYALLGLAAAAHGAGMLWPGWSGASGRLLASLAFAGYVLLTTTDILRSLAAERAEGGPEAPAEHGFTTSSPSCETVLTES